MKPEEDDDRKCDPLHNDPGFEAVVVLLQDGGKGLLQPEGVGHPHAQVQQNEEGDRLDGRSYNFQTKAKLPVVRVESSASLKLSCPLRPQ